MVIRDSQELISGSSEFPRGRFLNRIVGVGTGLSAAAIYIFDIPLSIIIFGITGAVLCKSLFDRCIQNTAETDESTAETDESTVETDESTEDIDNESLEWLKNLSYENISEVKRQKLKDILNLINNNCTEPENLNTVESLQAEKFSLEQLMQRINEYKEQIDSEDESVDKDSD